MKTINRLHVLRSAQWFAIVFIVILIGLHFVKPEFDPSWNFISEYQVGRAGWLMQVAFISLGLSCLLFVVGMWNELNITGKLGLVLLLITAGGMFIGGIFKTDPLNTIEEQQTMEGKLHQFGAMLDQLPFAALLITVALFRKHNKKPERWLMIVSLVVVWFGFVYFIRSIQQQFPEDGRFGPHVMVGWQNRFMIITQALWVFVIARLSRQNVSPSVATYEGAALS